MERKETKLEEKKIEEKIIEEYVFPEFNLTVKASSIEEATKKALELAKNREV